MPGRSPQYTPEMFEKHAGAWQALWSLYSNVCTVSQEMKLRRGNRGAFGTLIDTRLLAVREVYAWILEGNLVRTHLHSCPDFLATSNASVVGKEPLYPAPKIYMRRRAEETVNVSR
jgi:hypothetical protein